jgi:putative phosphoribosyl transferase
MSLRADPKQRLFPITADLVRLEADLVMPPQAQNVIVLVHSTSGGRYSVNSQLIADAFHQAGLATVALDLLTLHEEASDWHTKYLLFNVNLLAERLGGATDWLIQQPELQGLKVGYWGMGIEAGAAVLAAAKNPSRTGAIACLNGRLDLASSVLSQVTMPTLLMVSDEDSLAQRINQKAWQHISAEKRLEQVAGSNQGSYQPEVLKEIAGLAAEWFKQSLSGSSLRSEEQLVEL